MPDSPPNPTLPELYEAIVSTRAMRRFTTEPVTDEVIRRILSAAVQAPSGGNIQPYEFVVVRGSDKRAALGALYLKGWQRQMAAIAKSRRPARTSESAESIDRIYRAGSRLAENFADVPALVLVLAKRMSMTLCDDEGPLDIGPVYASVYPAVQNIILAARAFGLGTVLTTIHRIYEAEARKVCEIPDTYEIAAVLPLGHPVGSWGIARRRPSSELTSWEIFNARA